MPELVRFALDMDYSEALDMADALFEINYKETDVVNASADLIEIGRLLKSYSFDEINNLAFPTKKIEPILGQAMEFAHKYGLLGICNSIFAISDDIMLTKVDMDKANVMPFMGKARAIIDRSRSEQAYNFDDLDLTVMNLSKYIRIFFPDEHYMVYYDEYKDMDYNYWTRYSEPLPLFLMAARMIFEELDRNKHNKESLSLSFPGMIMHRSYNTEFKREYYRFQFISLLDAIRYFTFYGIKDNLDVFNCSECHKKVSKLTSKRRKFCDDPNCLNRFTVRESRLRKKEAESQQ